MERFLLFTRHCSYLLGSEHSEFEADPNDQLKSIASESLDRLVTGAWQRKPSDRFGPQNPDFPDEVSEHESNLKDTRRRRPGYLGLQLKPDSLASNALQVPVGY